MGDERVNYTSVQWGMFQQWALFSSCYFLFLFLCLCLSLLFLLSLSCFGHWSVMQLFHHMGHTVGTACFVCLSQLVFRWDAVLS